MDDWLPQIEFVVLTPRLNELSSITSSCNNVAECINSTHAAKLISLLSSLQLVSFADSKVSKALNLFPPDLR